MIKELICLLWGHVLIHPNVTRNGQPIFHERCPRCGEALFVTHYRVAWPDETTWSAATLNQSTTKPETKGKTCT